MRILFVLPGTGIAGGGLVVYEMINRLRKRGHDARLVTFEYNPQPIKWYPFNGPLEPFTTIKDLAAGSEVIVATLFTTHFFVQNELITDADKYYLVQARESWFFDKGLPERETWQDLVEKGYADHNYKALTVSTWLTNFLKKEYNKEALQLKIGLNKDIFYPEPTFPRNGGKIRILMETAGQYMPLRGIKEAQAALQGLENVEVWTIAIDKEPVFAGDKFWFRPAQDMIRKIFSSCDILLKTSWYEGLGLGPMQAMTCGCAVLTTNNRGCREYAVNEKNALIVPIKNVKAIHSALERLIVDESLRRSLIKGGFETAKTFEWEPTIDILEKEFINRRRKVYD
jgi:glycosyltransferase involved in cell wall biosynthesis